MTGYCVKGWEENSQLRYDIAIMSTKGMSVTAARELVDDMCGGNNIPLLLLHDFDDSGIVIGGTIASSSLRYRFRHRIKPIDLGFRWSDFDGLETEAHRCRYSAETLRRHGATGDEISFLLEGERVELNAMTSEEFIWFVERKLDAHGIKKVIPDKEILDEAYSAFARTEAVRDAVQQAIEMIPDADIDAPDDLEERIKDILHENPEIPWEEAMRRIAISA